MEKDIVLLILQEAAEEEIIHYVVRDLVERFALTKENAFSKLLLEEKNGNISAYTYTGENSDIITDIRLADLTTEMVICRSSDLI